MTRGTARQFDQAASKVLESLLSHPLGLTKFELERKCGLSRLEVGRACRTLKQGGFVDQKHGRMKATDLAKASPPEDIASAPAPSPKLRPTAPVVEEPTGWDVLRRVCDLYAECVRFSNASRIQFKLRDPVLDNEIRCPIPWFDLTTGRKWSAARADLPEAGAGLGGRDVRTILAGPFEFFASSRGEEACWRPVFLLPVTVQREASELHFTADGEVHLNLDWLNSLIDSRDPEAQEELQIQLHLLRENEELELEAIQQPNFEDCWDALRTALPGAEWQEERSLRDPCGASPLSAVKQPGLYARVLVFPEPNITFKQGLVRDLEAIAKASDEELSSCALAPFVADFVQDSEPSGPPEVEEEKKSCLPIDPLNDGQVKVVEAALHKRLSVVQGPPGTGKSTIVRNALTSLALQGETAIFASQNHRAVEAVVPRLNAVSEPEELILQMNPKNESGATTRVPLGTRALERVSLARDPAAAEALEDHVLGARDALSQISATRGKLRELLQERDALATIESSSKQLRTRHGDEWHSTAEQIAPIPKPEVAAGWVRKLTSDGFDLRKPWAAVRLRMLSRKLRRSAARGQLAFPEPLSTSSLGDLIQWQCLKAQRAELEDKIDDAASFESLGADLDRQSHALLEASRAAATLLPAAAPSRIPEGEASFLHALKAELHGGSSRRQHLDELLRRHFEVVLGAFPLWACTNLSVPSIVPRRVAAFDLAVVDEAAQCDAASILPILFRAKRVMIVGDPQQLGPVGRVARHTEDRLRQRFGLTDLKFNRFSYSANSAYDLARGAALASNDDHVILREHYRCHPAIADYFSNQFYNGALVVRTNLAVRRASKRGAGLRWSHVPGGSETIGSSRWHRPQAVAIVNELQRLAQEGFDGTVGVVTPFRPHANRIRDMAHSAIASGTLKKWDFVADTADGFQGGEKDIVFLGLVGGGNVERPTPPFYVRDPNRFNVAVSRAKSLLHVFGDKHWAVSCGIPALEALYRASQAEESEQTQSDFRRDLVGPVWEPLLARTMRNAGLDYWQQYQACGFYLDFAIFPEKGSASESPRKINIEVDGETYHRDRNGNLREEDVYRDQVLRAAGWTVKRFWVYELREDLDRCLKTIQALVQD